jgi:hypothetical protein
MYRRDVEYWKKRSSISNFAVVLNGWTFKKEPKAYNAYLCKRTSENK